MVTALLSGNEPERWDSEDHTLMNGRFPVAPNCRELTVSIPAVVRVEHPNRASNSADLGGQHCRHHPWLPRERVRQLGSPSAVHSPPRSKAAANWPVNTRLHRAAVQGPSPTGPSTTSPHCSPPTIRGAASHRRPVGPVIREFKAVALISPDQCQGISFPVGCAPEIDEYTPTELAFPHRSAYGLLTAPSAMPVS